MRDSRSNLDYLATIVSRDSVRKVLAYAVLNELDVNADNIQNIYFQVPVSKEHYLICGSEFGRRMVERSTGSLCSYMWTMHYIVHIEQKKFVEMSLASTFFEKKSPYIVQRFMLATK